MKRESQQCNQRVIESVKIHAESELPFQACEWIFADLFQCSHAFILFILSSWTELSVWIVL